jgi:prevent-host-death family protein
VGRKICFLLPRPKCLIPACSNMATMAMGAIVRSVDIAELKNRLSKYLSFVKAGEEVVIRDRNVPVAKLVPFSAMEASDEELLLVAAGKMRLPKSPVDIEKLFKIPTGTLEAGEAIQALLQDRDEHS